MSAGNPDSVSPQQTSTFTGSIPPALAAKLAHLHDAPEVRVARTGEETGTE